MYKNIVVHSKTKHIFVKYYVLRGNEVGKEIKLEHVSTKDWIADIFMKPLPKDNFEYLRGMLGVMPLPSSE